MRLDGGVGANSPDPSQPVLIWGAGSMGGTIGAALIEAGHAVRLVDTDRAHIEAILEHGLRIQGPIRSFAVAAEAVDPPGLSGRFQRIFLCVKAHHTTTALERLAPFLAPDGYVASIQNGLNELEIAAAVGPERTLGAFVNFGADVVEPGVIHWGGRGAVVLGELDGRSTPRLSRLQTLLRGFEPAVRTTDNIFGFLWGKLAYGAMLFVTALTDAGIADVFGNPRYQPLLVGIGREVARVAEAEGIVMEAFDGFDPAAFASTAEDGAALESIRDLEAFNRRSAKTHSGIWRDLAVRRRTTEVDAQLGPIVATGRRHRLPTPLILRVISHIHDIESGARRQTDANLDELAGVAEDRL